MARKSIEMTTDIDNDTEAVTEATATTKKPRKPRIKNPTHIVLRVTDADGNPLGKDAVNVEVITVTKNVAEFGRALVENVDRGGLVNKEFAS